MTAQTGPHVGRQTPEGVFDLALGQPSPRLLPLEMIADASARALPNADRLVLQYGIPAGWSSFRERLASWLGTASGVEIPASHVMASGAISLSLSLLADVFARRRKCVVIGDPTYFLAAGIFASAGLEVVRVPVDDRGLDVDALSRALEDGLSPDLVYCIPVHHNPTASCLSEERRLRLLELARAYDFVVVADEPYNLLEFDGPPVPPFACLDEGNARVISVGSFTKILAPGLRFGWIHADPRLLDRISRHGVLQSGGALNPVIAAVVEELLRTGELTRHLALLRTTYAERTAALAGALTRHFPAARVKLPNGGYFAWLRLPDDVDPARLLSIAKEHDLALCPGTRCGVSPELDRYLRLCVAFYESEELERGIERLANVAALSHS